MVNCIEYGLIIGYVILRHLKSPPPHKHKHINSDYFLVRELKYMLSEYDTGSWCSLFLDESWIVLW